MRRMPGLIALASAVLLCGTDGAFAADTFANADPAIGSNSNDCRQDTSDGLGAGPCLTISEAVNKTAGAGTVTIAPGTYAENVALNSAVALQGSGPDAVIEAPTVPACSGPALSIDGLGGPIANLAIRSACAATPAISIANTAVPAPAIPATVLSRVQISSTGAGSPGIEMASDTALNLDNTTVSSTGAGLQSTTSGTVTATNVTIAGAPDMSLTGTTLHMDSSILAGGGITGTGSCTIDSSRGPSSTGSGCADFETIQAPGFGSDPAKPFALAAGSPMIDAGNPSSTVPGPDVYGGSRVVDGDGNCATPTRIDIGADEFDGGGNCIWPVTTGAAQGRLQEIFSITSSARIGNYRLCVDGPGKRQCVRFRTRRSGGVDRGRVNWSRSFRYRGPGGYTVTWSTANGRRRLGAAQRFVWGACPPANLSMRGVWSPRRLIVIDRCRAVIGYPHTISNSEQDGDYHISFHRHERGAPGVLEIIPRDQPRHIPKPKRNRRYRITGVFVCDTFHGPMGHTEIHPVFRTELLGRGDRVLQTRTGGPQYPGTPSVHLRPEGRFHCPGIR